MYFIQHWFLPTSGDKPFYEAMVEWSHATAGVVTTDDDNDNVSGIRMQWGVILDSAVNKT